MVYFLILETNRSILALADRKHEYDDLTSDESDFDNDVDPDYELKKRIKDVSQQKELNDENRIPDMEDSMNKGPSANKVERNGIGSPFRENSIKSPSVVSFLMTSLTVTTNIMRSMKVLTFDCRFQCVTAITFADRLNKRIMPHLRTIILLPRKPPS